MKKILLGLLTVSLLMSCGSSKYFNEDYRQSIESAGKNIKDVQFYNDGKIVLQRKVNSDDLQTTKGKVKFKRGRYVEIIKIPKNTPGVCIKDNIKGLIISFEKNDNLNINFLGNKDKSFYRISDDKNWLLTKQVDNRYIQYGEKRYEVIKGSSVQLKMKDKIKYEKKKDKRKVKGRKIS